MIATVHSEAKMQSPGQAAGQGAEKKPDMPDSPNICDSTLSLQRRECSKVVSGRFFNFVTDRRERGY